MVELYADLFEENPLEVHRQEDGEIQLKDTGDPFVDKWEEEMAEGKIPNLAEAFSDEELAEYLRLRAKTRGLAEKVSLQEAFSELTDRQHKLAGARMGASNLNTFGDGTD